MTDFIAGLWAISDGGAYGRRSFLQDAAGLGRFVGGIELQGGALLFARDLVGKLERFGRLPDRPTYHALGALLDAAMGQGEVGGDEATFVAGVIVRYSLVADPTYLRQLRERHGVTDDVLVQAPPEVVAPLIDSSQMAESPDFEPAIADESSLEAIIHSEDNFIDMSVLREALYCGRAVGRIEIPEGTAKGTGFLVGPDLLLTNQHVLKHQDYLEETVVSFNFMHDRSGVEQPGRFFKVSKDFYHVSPAEELDYALVRLMAKPLEGIAAKADDALLDMAKLAESGKHKGYLPLAPVVVPEGNRVNIIQHPDGDPLKVVLTQNHVVKWTPSRIQYVADTMQGSSGSPVFDSRWQLVALHHSGRPYPKESAGSTVKKAWKGRFRVNEGIPIRAILEDFKKRGIERYLPRD